MGSKVGFLREKLAKQTIRIFVGPSLPRVSPFSKENGGCYFFLLASGLSLLVHNCLNVRRFVAFYVLLWGGSDTQRMNYAADLCTCIVTLPFFSRLFHLKTPSSWTIFASITIPRSLNSLSHVGPM